MSRFEGMAERTMLICSDATAQVVTAAGVQFDAAGIFDNAEIDYDVRKEGAGSGGVSYKKRQPVFTSGDLRFAGIDKNWKLTIRGTLYFCAEPYVDGAGWVTLWLAREQGAEGEVGNGGKWR